MRSLIVVDVDHTLSDAAWRDCLMPHRGDPDAVGDWTAYYASQALDEPIQRVVNFVCTMAHSHDVWIITARVETYRLETEMWLARHKIPYVRLLMRPVGDKRGSPELKLWMVQEVLRDIAMLIDDREDVLDAFHARGVPILPPGMIG
jgi:hypothetical protein